MTHEHEPMTPWRDKKPRKIRRRWLPEFFMRVVKDKKKHQAQTWLTL